MEFGISFSVLLVLTLIGSPVSMAVGACSAVYLLLAGVSLQAVPQKMFTTLDNSALLAVPLYLLAGFLMNTAGFTDRLFGLARRLVGHIRGSLAHASVVASMIFAGMTGSAVAEATGLGVIEIKAMEDAGFDRDFATAVTLASSTIGPIIPPSIIMVIYGVVADVSVGALFLGGIIPGTVMGICLMVMVYVISARRDYPLFRRATLGELLSSFLSAIPPMVTPVIIVGGLLAGVFTATEGAVAAVVYTLIIGLFVYKWMNWRDIPKILLDVGVTTAVISLVVSTTGVFGWVLARQQIPVNLMKAILNLTDNVYLVLLLINVVILIEGCFLDATPIILLMVPVLLPLLKQLNVDPLHFGVLISINTMIGLTTPPVGVCLYGVAAISKLPVERITRAMWPFWIALMAALFLVTYIPQSVLFIPHWAGRW